MAGGAAAADDALPLRPLTVSALMVTKADLILALRVYVPGLADIEEIGGGRFLLSVGEASDAAPSAAAAQGGG